ncbi:MAG: Lpg1974 family pore-forming outer membrane protein, partial [Chlamydiota bacterium]
IKNKEPSTDPVHGRVKNVNFNWDFGFRLGAGYNFEHDEWDANLCFTWYQCAAHSHTKARSGGSIIPEYGILSDLGRKAKVEWNVGYYVLDAELGRHYFVSKFLSFRPFFGIETAWINQHMQFNEHILPGGPQSRQIVKNKNDFWGIGPRAGLTSNWHFCESLSLFGKVSGALLWGDFDIHEKEKAKGTTPLKLSNIDGDFHCIVPNAQMILGIQYDVNFNDNCNHIGIMLGYEFQYWWKQNQILNNRATSSPTFERESGDLSLNGVTLDVRFDF